MALYIKVHILEALVVGTESGYSSGKSEMI